MNLTLRPAGVDDLSALVELENRCFDYDRLSRRNFQWMLTRAHASLTVAEGDGGVLGYALVLFHEGTSLARLYSIAIDPRARGIGLGQKLLEAAEQAARDNDRAYMRRGSRFSASPNAARPVILPSWRFGLKPSRRVMRP